MSIYFVDPSASTNGDGTAATPYNNLETCIASGGHTYYVRRVAAITANRTINLTTIPQDTKIIGWPLPGDIYYADRPTGTTWDSDPATHPSIATRLQVNTTHSVQVHRLRFDLQGITLPSIPEYKQVYLYASSNIEFKYVTMDFTPTPSGAYTNRGFYIDSCRQVYLDLLLNYYAFNINAATAYFYCSTVFHSVIRVTLHTKAQTGTPSTSTPHSSPDVGLITLDRLSLSHFHAKLTGDAGVTTPWVYARSIYLLSCNNTDFKFDYTSYPALIEPLVLYLNLCLSNRLYAIGPRLGNVVLFDSRQVDTVLITDELVCRKLTLNAIELLQSNDLCEIQLIPYSQPAVKFTNNRTYDVVLAGGSSLTAQSLAKYPTISFPNTINAATALFRDNSTGIVNFVSAGGNAFSSGIRRVGHDNGYQLRIKAALTGYQPVIIGDNRMTPYYLSLTAGTKTLSLHGAILPTSDYLPREGELILILTWVDTKGKHVEMAVDLTYIPQEPWDNLLNPVCFKVSATITLASDTAVRGILHCRAAGRYEYLLVDDRLTVE